MTPPDSDEHSMKQRELDFNDGRTSSEPDNSSTTHEAEAISARSVMHLTTEKLYRKRAFDRRNQRDSRARQKARLQELEQENLDLRAKVDALQVELQDAQSHNLPTDPKVARYAMSDMNAPRIWHVFPLSVAPMCRLDHVMFHLVKSGQQPDFLQATIEEIAQSSFPHVVSLLNPAAAEVAPVASMIGLHGPWMQITSSAARIAVMYDICLYIRWLLSPTEANYMAMPTHLRPTPLQLTTPHPMWINIMPWPYVREQLIKDMDWDKDFENFRRIHNQTVSVNWPYPLSDVLVSDGNDGISLNPVFEAHIRTLENWTAGPELAQTFSFARLIPQHPAPP